MIIASSAIIIAVTVWSLFLGVMTISKAALSSHSKKNLKKKLKKETFDFAQQQNGNHANKTKEASLDGGESIDLRQVQERQMYQWNIDQERRSIAEASSW